MPVNSPPSPDSARTAPGRRDQSGRRPKDEREGSHQHGPETKLCALQPASGAVCLLELSLANSTMRMAFSPTDDEHHQARSGCRRPARTFARAGRPGRQHRDGKGEQHAERKRPALIERGEMRKYADEREQEGLGARAGRLLLLVGEVATRSSSREQHLVRPARRGPDLGRAVAGRRVADELDCAEQVEAIRKLGTVDPLGGMNAERGTIWPVPLRT